MGNPAGDKRKLKEKRRKSHEKRIGPGTYLPKEVRQELQADIARATADAKK